MEDISTPYPKYLRLGGITRADWCPVEDVADMRLLQGVGGPPEGPEDPAPESIYPPDKIPRTFNGDITQWPYETNLHCWECGFRFAQPPKFAPTHVRESEDGGVEFGVLGNMCTFNCAALWISTRYAGQVDQLWRMQDNLCLLYFLFTGRRVSRIPLAPNKTELRRYGGDLEDEVFLAKLRSLDPSSAGLRNHTPGSIVPERNRMQGTPECDRLNAAIATIRASIGHSGAPVMRAVSSGDESLGSRPFRAGGALLVSQKSVWGVCGHVAGGAPGDVAAAGAAAAADAAGAALGAALGNAAAAAAALGAAADAAAGAAAAAAAADAAADAAAADAAAAAAAAAAYTEGISEEELNELFAEL